jgi:hypothetical protein
MLVIGRQLQALSGKLQAEADRLHLLRAVRNSPRVAAEYTGKPAALEQRGIRQGFKH